MADAYAIRPIGRVSSPLADPEAAPKQGFEGAPDATLVFDPEVAVDGLRVLVQGLEAVDGTPIVDVKPVLTGDGEAGSR